MGQGMLSLILILLVRHKGHKKHWIAYDEFVYCIKIQNIQFLPQKYPSEEDR